MEQTYDSQETRQHPVKIGEEPGGKCRGEEELIAFSSSVWALVSPLCLVPLWPERKGSTMTACSGGDSTLKPLTVHSEDVLQMKV